ncbi:MAG: peptidyl-prolyl cis-trans isomerase [Chitinophagaceae bacterium]|nr:peptidyl-prolyl cis-trans isomerase [Chitinophagaceae bacterium]
MNKRWLIALTVSFLFLQASSQPLFTYGKYTGETSDFLRAFNKNNAQTSKDKSKAMKDYLDLYINSRLKIQEAYARGYDTLAQIKSEVDNLRSQIIDKYMNDPAAETRLVNEAFQRSLKDIHVGHIFVSFTSPSGAIDKAAADKKLNKIITRLNKGEDFFKVATDASDEPASNTQKGDLGYVTLMSLPYAIENIIYKLPVGKVSKPFTSKAGYHFFKNLGERKAVGKIKAQQILLAIPPSADGETKKKIGLRADSLYSRIMAGGDFSLLAAEFSNDYISAATGGNIPDISVGQYDAEFEKNIWGLSKDGAVSKPFLTNHGFHIVKRISVKPVVTDPGDKTNMDDLKQRISFDDRWKTAGDFIYERVKSKAGFRKLNYNETALWAYSDSILESKPIGNGRIINTDTKLFTIGDTTIPVTQWIAYAQAFRYKADRSGLKAYPDLMDEFTKNAMHEYYRSHLEEFNEEFRIQMSEFRDGNLFFEIMQQEIWNRTQNDSSALLSLYQKNKDKYHWQPSADAIIFFSSDAATARSYHDQLKKEPSSWKKVAESISEKGVADSARFEWGQIPGLENTTPVAGAVTSLVINPTDNTASFAYIVKVYTSPAPRTFNEARGLVMNDYQAWLEEQWIKDLRKKYPVVVNQKQLQRIAK